MQAAFEEIEKQKGILFPPVLRSLCEAATTVRAGDRWELRFADGSRLALHEHDRWEPTFLELTTDDGAALFFVHLNPSSPAYGKVWWMDHQGAARREDRLVADSLEDLFEPLPSRGREGMPAQLQLRAAARARLRDLGRRRG